MAAICPEFTEFAAIPWRESPSQARKT
jgi:hypothetical protein